MNNNFRSRNNNDSRKRTKDLSHIHCFRCDKFGHHAKECKIQPNNQEAHINEVDDKENKEEFIFFYVLSSNIPTDGDTWLIDSGASKHITGYKNQLIDLTEKESNLHMVIGDDAQYFVRVFGDTTLNLDSGISL